MLRSLNVVIDDERARLPRREHLHDAAADGRVVEEGHRPRARRPSFLLLLREHRRHRTVDHRLEQASREHGSRRFGHGSAGAVETQHVEPNVDVLRIEVRIDRQAKPVVWVEREVAEVLRARAVRAVRVRREEVEVVFRQVKPNRPFDRVVGCGVGDRRPDLAGREVRLRGGHVDRERVRPRDGMDTQRERAALRRDDLVLDEERLSAPGLRCVVSLHLRERRIDRRQKHVTDGKRRRHESERARGWSTVVEGERDSRLCVRRRLRRSGQEDSRKHLFVLDEVSLLRVGADQAGYERMKVRRRPRHLGVKADPLHRLRRLSRARLGGCPLVASPSAQEEERPLRQQVSELHRVTSSGAQPTPEIAAVTR